MTAAPSVRVSEAFPPGFIIVDKPQGQTSFAMVALLRRLTGVRRIGHAGTLDPMATGVLPVAIGDATRLIEYMDDETKVYAANVRFGVSTDTYDAEGEVVAEADASGVTAASVEGLLPAFTGDVVQRPPSFSAIKVGGKPLYRYAREGGAVQAAERVVRIESIALVAFEHPVARLEVRCGKGTYIRSLAHDLGQLVGCGAHLSALRRAESGGFTLSDAHSIERIDAAADAGELERLLLAPDCVLERQPAAILGDERRQLLVDGRDLPLGGPGDAGICRAYSTEGAFIGVLRRTSSGAWHPEKVLASAR